MKFIFSIRKLLKNKNGSATVEFALVAVSFVILIPIVVDIATVINKSIILSSSVRAGVQYAISEPDDNSGITQVINNASGFPSGSISVSVSQSCQCSGESATCNSVCDDGSVAKNYNTITATYDVPIILPYANYPNNSYTISRSATVEVK